MNMLASQNCPGHWFKPWIMRHQIISLLFDPISGAFELEISELRCYFYFSSFRFQMFLNHKVNYSLE